MSLRCYIGMGTNLGDRLARLRAASAALAELPGCELRASSRIWETHPMGPGSGPFLNAAVELSCTLSPELLLAQLARIELELGRVRRERWGDRSIDLDLLCVFDERGVELHVSSERLSLPHPGIHARDFVLAPLIELDPELVTGGLRCADSLAALSEEQRTLIGAREPGLSIENGR